MRRWGVWSIVALVSGAQLQGCDDGVNIGPALNVGGVAGDAALDAGAGVAGSNGSAGSSGAGGSVDAHAGSGGSAAGSGGASGAGMMDSDASSGGTMNGEPHCREDLPGPALVEVPAPTGSLLTSYCMDATEVSAAHYAEFLAAAVPISGQLSKCSWNTSFDDGATPLPAVDGGLGDPQPAPAGNMPMRNVDWCDAYAYCDWAGKRLCGALAGTGTNEWEHACSAGNEQRFPYGNTYQPLACNGFDNTGSGSVPVGSIPECEGGYPGLFDLSGNVWEWQFPCMGSGENVVCEYRGGSYTTELEGPLRCDVPLTESIMLRGDIGIRCCADLVQ